MGKGDFVRGKGKRIDDRKGISVSKGKIGKYPFKKTSKKDRLVKKVSLNNKNRYGIVEDGVWYPNSSFIEDTHLIMLEKYGGFPGFERGIGIYSFILEKMKLAKGVFGKASILLREIISGRIFKDGNHRTALVVTETFMEMNNVKMCEESPEKRYIFIKDFLRYSLNEIEEWLKHGSIEKASNEDP